MSPLLDEGGQETTNLPASIIIRAKNTVCEVGAEVQPDLLVANRSAKSTQDFSQVLKGLARSRPRVAHQADRLVLQR